MFSAAFPALVPMHYLSMPARAGRLAASDLLASAFPALRGTARGTPVVPPSFHHFPPFASMSNASCKMRASAWYRSCLPPSGMDTDPSAMPEQKAKVEADASSAISTSFLPSRSDCFPMGSILVSRAFAQLVEQRRHFLLLHSCFPSRHLMYASAASVFLPGTTCPYTLRVVVALAWPKSSWASLKLVPVDRR